MEYIVACCAGVVILAFVVLFVGLAEVKRQIEFLQSDSREQREGRWASTTALQERFAALEMYLNIEFKPNSRAGTYEPRSDK